jgi:hypothetical protein
MEQENSLAHDPELVEDLVFYANLVINNWESGDLAGAVNALRETLETMDARCETEECE